MNTRLTRLPLLAAALVLVACAGPAATRAPSLAPVATPGPATVAPATLAPPTAAPTAAATAATGEVTVQLASSALGDIVVDGAGMTLYGFTPDEPTGEPTCYDECADNWPPLIAPTDITVGEGLDEAAFTVVPRTDDAGDQVKFDIYPLYYFAGDSAAGDVNGQGLGDNWFVIGADGELITE